MVYLSPLNMYPDLSYTIYPLSESALVIDFGQHTEVSINQKVISIYDQFIATPFSWKHEWVPAYSSLTLYVDLFDFQQREPSKDPLSSLEIIIRERLSQLVPQSELDHPLHAIPVCYDMAFGPDQEEWVKSSGLSIEQLIALHTDREYRVCFLGFLPGFAYMAEVDERIAVPRKQQPSARVPAGSVGIAGRQTGIYPLASPGGWNVIGRTPIHLFKPEETKPVVFRAGDRVRFYPITKHEFDHYEGGHS